MSDLYHSTEDRDRYYVNDLLCRSFDQDFTVAYEVLKFNF